jgi:sulfate adenylyltransferase subunit 1 (EFTu-like GTPase family)
LEDEVDASRGDMIVRPHNHPQSGKSLEAMVCWMSEKPLQVGGKYLLLHTTNFARAVVTDVIYKVNIHELSRDEQGKKIQMNDIGRIALKTTKPIFWDSYRKNRITGSFILIDEATNATVGACMIS